MANNFTVATYSPSDVSLTLGGYTLSGWDRINISRRTDSFKPIYGIRGKHTRVRSGGKESRDSSCFITIALSQESQANDVLSEIHRQDIDEGTARIALTLKDESGSSVFSSHEAYILTFANAEFSNDFGTREWRIFCQSTETYNVGSNTKPQTSLLDSAISEVTSFVSDIF
jgi:hypothetical protein